MTISLTKILEQQPLLAKTTIQETPNTKFMEFINTYTSSTTTFNKNSIIFCVENAIKFVKHTNFKKYEIIYLGTDSQTIDFIKLGAYRCSQNYMTTKWVPGLLTNWKHKHKDFEYYRQLKKKFLTISLSGLQAVQGTTRSKRLVIKKYLKSQNIWKGMVHIKEKPKLLLITDAAAQQGAIREAHRTNIPTIAFCNSHTNPELITYPIPCDTNNIEAVLFYLELFTELFYQKTLKK